MIFAGGGIELIRNGMNGDRAILHSDCNCFYASVEMHLNPELRGTAMCVGGDVERRHGIVLAKSPLAKAAGVKTGEALWQAREKCPGLIVTPPHFKSYMRYSRLARMIYYDYTNQVEPFGLDEAWLDVTGSERYMGESPAFIAQEISERIKAELGITVSIGVSWNKIFAKLGSDSDAGDGIMVITRDNYRDVVWPRAVGDLIYVGPSTQRKLAQLDIFTIGDLANASSDLLHAWLGKMGPVLKLFANGADVSPVKVMNPAMGDVEREVKSIGNGLTSAHNIESPQDAKALIWLLSESVAQRLRESNFIGKTIGISVRDAQFLTYYTRQVKLERPTCITREIAHTAYDLLCANEPLDAAHPLRALGVWVSGLMPLNSPVQYDLFGIEDKRRELENLDFAIDGLRHRFGNRCVMRLSELCDNALDGVDIKDENVIHPVGFFHD
ncbi:MAG: hypothetical protein IKE43_07110 [Coriobacteriales bacterium]|nr:hypothetical protein [Coriobacteriales bacterium]